MSSPQIVPTPVTPQQLTTDYQEFGNAVTYPASMINYWLSVATLMIDPNKWARLTGVGIELFTAHNLVLEAQALATVSVGGLPGLEKGPISSEGVGSVNVSYDVQAGINKDAAHWNLTVYGTRFYKLMRIFGAGPVHLGTGQPVGNATSIGGIGGVNPPFQF